MNEITYQNKVALNENPEIADINKVTDDDMNEIKSVVNTNSRTSSNNFGLGTDTWTSSATYSIGDIVVYNDNTYKNLTGTNTTTTPDQDSTNWEVMPLIVNEYNTSTKNAYSSNKVNELIQDTYSVNEVKTNKVWINGKPIYRKTFVGVANIQASSSSAYLFTLPTGYSEIVDYYGKFTWQSFMQTFPMVWGNDACALRIVADTMHYLSNFGIGSGAYAVTVEYTKTTD